MRLKIWFGLGSMESSQRYQWAMPIYGVVEVERQEVTPRSHAEATSYLPFIKLEMF
jgi:hypothetical protein